LFTWKCNNKKQYWSLKPVFKKMSAVPSRHHICLSPITTCQPNKEKEVVKSNLAAQMERYLLL
jgi:hypothetical protein